jgi:hypothetical protein
MELKALKLVSGEVIMGVVVKTTDDTITLENPVHIISQPTIANPHEPDRITISMMMLPATPYSGDKTLELERLHVMATVTPNDDLTTQYRSQFSGLVLPTPSLLT